MYVLCKAHTILNTHSTHMHIVHYTQYTYAYSTYTQYTYAYSTYTQYTYAYSTYTQYTYAYSTYTQYTYAYSTYTQYTYAYSTYTKLHTYIQRRDTNSQLFLDLEKMLSTDLLGMFSSGEEETETTLHTGNGNYNTGSHYTHGM